MRELVRAWSNTRMVVLIALTAGLYGALTVPFKVITIIPGFTEIRPTAVIPALMGVVSGPAGAWGAGIGNVVGDFIGGTAGPGSVFGFLGNVCFAYAAYKLSRPVLGRMGFAVDGSGVAGQADSLSVLPGRIILAAIGAAVATCALAFSPFMSAVGASLQSCVAYGVVIAAGLTIGLLGLSRQACAFATTVLPVALGASLVCGGVIGWGLELLGILPFASLGVTIAINNAVCVAVLLPLLLPSIYPRMKRWGLCTEDLLKPEDMSRPRAPRVGRAILWVAAIGVFAVGIGSYFGETTAAQSAERLAQQGVPLAVAQCPFIALIIVGLWQS